MKRQQRSASRAGVLMIGVMSAVLVQAACARSPSSRLTRDVLIDVGDTTLHAEIRGQHDADWVLLYLHGGPGSPLGVPVFRAYGGRLLEDHCVVVYLHQRGVMPSPRVPDDGHRVDRYVSDVARVVAWLERELPGRRLALLGHSWGGVLGYLYLSRHASPVQKLIAVSTPVDVQSMMRGRLDMILHWAEATGEQEAIRDLTPLLDLDVREDSAAFEVLGTWSSRAYGGWARHLSRDRVEAAMDDANRIPAGLEAQRHIETLMRRELLQLDLRQAIATIDLPLLCIVGREDVDVPWYLVRDEMAGYGGPIDFRVFDRSHHMPFIDEEDRFVGAVVPFLRSGPGVDRPPAPDVAR